MSRSATSSACVRRTSGIWHGTGEIAAQGRAAAMGPQAQQDHLFSGRRGSPFRDRLSASADAPEAPEAPNRAPAMRSPYDRLSKAWRALSVTCASCTRQSSFSCARIFGVIHFAPGLRPAGEFLAFGLHARHPSAPAPSDLHARIAGQIVGPSIDSSVICPSVSDRCSMRTDGWDGKDGFLGELTHDQRGGYGAGAKRGDDAQDF
jgi:hypothetical protein